MVQSFVFNNQSIVNIDMLRSSERGCFFLKQFKYVYNDIEEEFVCQEREIMVL